MSHIKGEDGDVHAEEGSDAHGVLFGDGSRLRDLAQGGSQLRAQAQRDRIVLLL